MKNLNLVFATIIFAFFTLTSCEKDGINELQTTAKETISQGSSNSNRAVPAQGIHTVNQAALTEATLETTDMKAQSRARYYSFADCGATLEETTLGQGNSVDSKNMLCHSEYGDLFDGPDNFFLLTVEDQPEAIVTYHITISDLNDDLDLFLYTLDANGALKDCKATSITIGKDVAESIEVTGLNAGYYLIVVDSWAANISSSYTLEVNCSAVSANPPSISEIDVNRVDFGHGNEHLGTYHQITATTWKEVSADPNGNDFDFVETHRDEWSVYLTDESRGVNIQLDIHRKKVRYSDPQSPIRDQYDIIQSLNKMNGYLTSKVSYSTGNQILGYFTQEGDSKNWKETKADASSSFDFVETHRDEWSVYLRDASRGINIQLDMHTAKVEYSNDNGQAFTLYLIEIAE